MCEKEPKHKSCTTCPQYDGMKCTATDFTLGARDEVLQQEHRRGFICLDTGEAELKGDAVLQWTAEQERLSQEKGYKSVNEMWAAEGKQVKSGFRIDEDNEHLEPVLQVSNGPGPVKLTFQYEEEPKSATADCIADMLHKGEGGPFTNVFTGAKMPDGIIHMVDCNPAHAQFQYRPEALPKYAGSPSEEVHPVGMDTPRKGKIAENSHLHNTIRCALIRNPEAHCGNCNKSHTEGDRLVCDKWGLQDILMPYRPCEKWALDPAKIKSDDQEEVPSLYKEGMSTELAPGTILVMPDNGIGITNAVSAESVWNDSTPILCSAPADEKGTTFTDQEIAELTDAMRTVRRILEQHGVTL